MNYKDIVIADDGKHFLYKGEVIFGDIEFEELLKFHSEGIAAVKLSSREREGDIFYYWQHINLAGQFYYETRYYRTFGYYFERAAVCDFGGNCYHIDTAGNRVYLENYQWAGNYQQGVSVVRLGNVYFHIDKSGKRFYNENYLFAGDYKDDFACVKMSNGYYNHINLAGICLYKEAKFLDLGVFHKNIATARDANGYFHINKQGNSLYEERYLQIEPFYNGFAAVTNFDYSKKIISEAGETVIKI
jgi:WG containing repeat